METREIKEPVALERATAIYGVLVARGAMSQERFDEEALFALESGCELEDALLDLFKLPKRVMGDALSSFYKFPFIEPDPKFQVAPELTAKLNPHYLSANLWAPMWREDSTVSVVMRDPHSTARVQDIQHVYPGCQLRVYVGLKRDIRRFIDALAAAKEAKHATIEQILSEEARMPAEPAADDQEPGVDESDGVVVRLASQLISDAVSAGASDIHLEPYPDKDIIVRFRVDGDCRIHQKLPARYRRALPARFKIMAGLDIAERRKPQDGKLAARAEDGRKIELRLATIPTAGGLEDVVLRVAGSTEPVPLEKNGLSARHLKSIVAMLDHPHGLFLCVGPTGSGKTTTLHSCLSYLNGPDLKIWTAEDPVEIVQYGLRQVQVNAKIGLTFAHVLRSFLRADPDVIMVGEMRDRETADTAIEASMTGHLVLSTLHTNSAVETVARLLDMGVDPFNYSDALLGVLSQRLVRKLCEKCRKPCEAPSGYAGSFFSGAGCEACGGSGYKGRLALQELLVATPEIKRLIQKRAPVAELLSLAKSEGLATLLEDGLEKCRSGETDWAQLSAATAR